MGSDPSYGVGVGLKLNDRVIYRDGRSLGWRSVVGVAVLEGEAD